MASGDVYELVVVGNAQSQFVENVFQFQVVTDDGSDPLIVAKDLVTKWVATLQSLFLTCLDQSYILVGTRCKRVRTAGGWTYTLPNNLSTGLNNSGVVITTEVGGCITFPYLPSGGTKWRSGRIFMPCASSAQVIKNVLQATYITALKAFAAALLLPQTSTHGTYQFGIHYKKPAQGFADAEEYVISGGIGTQRKRAVAVLGKPNRSSRKRKKKT